MADTQITNNSPYRPQDIEAAYKAIYGGLPASMADLETGGISKDFQGAYPGAVLPTPGGQQIDASQLMYMYQQGKAQQAAATTSASGPAGTLTSGSSPSYLNTALGNTATLQGNSFMATPNTSSGGQISPQQAINYFAQAGGSPNVDANTAMAFFAKQNPNFGASGVTSQDAMNYYIQHGGSSQADPVTAMAFYEQQNPDLVQKGLAAQKVQPETNALTQMGQIDPASEALRQQLTASYADPGKAANPTAADYQSYLDTFKQVDPAEYAARQGLGTSMDSYLKSVQDQYALGSKLDPVTARQVEQQARAGQAARGNVYGTPQMVSEAMATGQAGEARLQQRQAALGAALGGQQSYLGSGLGLGDTAMQLYQQGLQNKANAQQSAMSYLSSGQTPYQAGASYLDRANANAATAAQGGPVYNPAALGAGQLGTAQQAPQYGLDVGAQAQNYFNSLNNAYGGAGGAATKNKTGAALSGAATGAISGGMAGATLAPASMGISIPVGAVIGGALGGASGYFS
jgi:hypothetical protein